MPDTSPTDTSPANTSPGRTSPKETSSDETEATTLLIVREPFRGFVKGQQLTGPEALAVLASEHLHYVVVLRRGDPAA